MNLGSENETLEFKKSIGELKEGVISICSMLNKTGYGTLYFGVKNDGTIIGQEIGVMTLKNISQAIANFIKPQIIPTILVEFIEDSKNSIPKDDIQKKRASEVYDHYTLDLKGNSYIHDGWQKYVK